MYCTNCGANVAPNQQFCPTCGARVASQGQPAAQTHPENASGSVPLGSVYQGTAYSGNSFAGSNPAGSIPVNRPAPNPPQGSYTITEDNLPNQFKPLSPWAYVGYSILFGIPGVGLILMIVFSFTDDNINRRNYARSFFCWMLIGIIIGAAVIGLLFATGAIYKIINSIHW